MTVFNKSTSGLPLGAVYVGRPSKWGNPFAVGPGPRGRETALFRYRLFLLSRPDLVAAARQELAGKDLVCWCAPKACHADILARVAAGGPV